jgi:hypothetical protein
MPNELELDKLFWDKFSTNQDFQKCLLDLTKFKGQALSLVTEGVWHQRWYRNPETKKDSETDITLTFKNSATGHLYAIHIENKPPHRMWEKDQAEGYRPRAINRMKAWRHQDCTVGLIATSKYLAAYPRERACFDFTMTYEEIGNYVQEFAVLCSNPV